MAGWMGGELWQYLVVNCVSNRVGGERCRWQGEVGCWGRVKAIAVGRVRSNVSLPSASICPLWL